jgi:hypothetical protein
MSRNSGESPSGLSSDFALASTTAYESSLAENHGGG